MTRDELESVVLTFMDSFTTMTLACSEGDEPWAAAVYYARRGFDLIFFSSRDSRHSQAFESNPRAAAAIHGDYVGWKEIKGLQMEGTVERIRGATAKARALSVYLKRHPFAKEFLPESRSAAGILAPAAIKKLAKIGLYVFRPGFIRYVDNEAGFGAKWALKIEKGKAVGEALEA